MHLAHSPTADDPPRAAGKRPSGLSAAGDLCLIGVAVFLVFGGSVSNDFVWDDGQVVLPFHLPVRDAFRPAFWTSGFYESATADYFRPLAALTFVADQAWLGEGAAGMRGVNLVYHALTSFLLYFLLAGLAGNRLGALAGALFFAVHPLRAESVALIGGRTDILAAFFCLASYWTLAAAARARSSAPRLVAAGFAFGACYLLALLCKEAALPLLFLTPALLFSSAVSPGLRGRLPLFGSAAVCSSFALAFYLVVRRRAMGGVASAYHLEYALAHYGLFAWKYLQLHFSFAALAPFSPTPQAPAGWLAAANAGWIAPLAGCWALARRGWTTPLLGLAVFLVFLAPVSGVVPLAIQFADRYSYLPSLGVSLILGAVVSELLRWRPDSRTLVATALVVGLVLVGFCGARQAAAWRDDATLWSVTTARNRHSVHAWTNLGSALVGKNDRPRALAALERADELAGHRDPTIILNLADCCLRLGMLDRAEQLFNDALSYDFHPDIPLYYLARIALAKGDPVRARQIVDAAERDGFCAEKCQRLQAAMANADGQAPPTPAAD